MSLPSSAVTYTSVYTDSEPGRVFWGADEELLDRGPEHPPSPVEVPCVPEPKYLEYIVPSDDEAPMEDQPLLVDASPVALSPGYIADSDLEEDPEEDFEEDHADYLIDGGDDDDEPYDDDDDDDDDTDDEDKEPFEDEEEEEHLAPADSPAAPVIDHVPSAEDTEAFERGGIPSPPLPPPPSSLHLPPPVPTSLPLPLSPLPLLPASLFIPPFDCREDTFEAELPPRKRLCLTALTSRYENNMPPKRTSATARAAAAAAATAPITATAGTEGVVVLAQWFERMESVFHISNCAVENQVKFATCTFLGNVLTWMFHEELEKVEKYVGGLPDMIRGNVMSYQPKTMEKAIEFADDQMDQKVLTISERQAEQNKKIEFNAGNNQGYQQQNKRQNTRRAYTAGPGEKREYTGSLPLCTKCNCHHKGPCAPRCNQCKKIGHLARDCRSSGPNGNNNNRRNYGITQDAGTCYEF
ncbi:reverse transcriptase domain-containing protein [Tanacetum coccineum]|uniref:Reverse transcriptase domain-containing protein n=1 Tax=Tanacetum coccineum TaxID=301880 RepID=A0ABQ4Y9I0_9ASTR